jgi:hypothetical protein
LLFGLIDMLIIVVRIFTFTPRDPISHGLCGVIELLDAVIVPLVSIITVLFSSALSAFTLTATKERMSARYVRLTASLAETFADGAEEASRLGV